MSLFSKIKKISICSLLSVGTLVSAGSTGLSAIDPRESVVCGGGLISSESSVRLYAIRAIKKLGGEPAVILVPKNCTLSSGNVIVYIPQKIVSNGVTRVISVGQRIVSVGKFVSAYSSESLNSEYRVVLGYIPENASLSNETVTSYIPQVMNTPGKPTIVLVPQEINLIGTPERAYISYSGGSSAVPRFQIDSRVPQSPSPVNIPRAAATNTQVSQVVPNGTRAGGAELNRNLPINSCARPNAFQGQQSTTVPSRPVQSLKILNIHSSPILKTSKVIPELTKKENQKLAQHLQNGNQKLAQNLQQTAANSNVIKLNQSLIRSINSEMFSNMNKQQVNRPEKAVAAQNLSENHNSTSAPLPPCSKLLSKDNPALRVISNVTNDIAKANQSTVAPEKHANTLVNPVDNEKAGQSLNNVNRANPVAPAQKSSEIRNAHTPKLIGSQPAPKKTSTTSEEMLKSEGWIRREKAYKTTLPSSPKLFALSERAAEKVNKEISNKEVLDDSDDTDSIIHSDSYYEQFIETQGPVTESPTSNK